MDYELSDDLRVIRKAARDFAEREILPVVGEDEKSHRFQREIVSKMGEQGFFGCPIPEEYGGSNTGFLAQAIITEEIAKVSGSLRASFNMQTMGRQEKSWNMEVKNRNKNISPN